MADIPHQLVARGIEAVVQCDRKLDNSQPCADVAAGDGALFDQKGTNIRRKSAHLIVREGADVSGGLDAV